MEKVNGLLKASRKKKIIRELQIDEHILPNTRWTFVDHVYVKLLAPCDWFRQRDTDVMEGRGSSTFWSEMRPRPQLEEQKIETTQQLLQLRL